jgi:hypothetical protein
MAKGSLKPGIFGGLLFVMLFGKGFSAVLPLHNKNGFTPHFERYVISGRP